MDGGWSGRLARPLVVGLVVMATASGLLLAQSAEKKADRSGADGPAQVTSTRPAEGGPLVERPAAVADAEDPEQSAARERLLSGLIGSKHDFTKNGKDGRDLCLTCHTPHLVSAPAARLDRRAETTQPLQPYQAMEAELDGWSLLCLGCHDGVTAPSVYSNVHATTIVGQLGNSRLGSRGLRSHPVGIRYPFGRADYQPLAAVEAAGLLLPGGRLQCATCHDAHNTDRHEGMLRISNERSRMCLTCHRL